MGFEYSHTCPDIDRAINAAKDSINSQLEDLVGECCPMLEGEQLVDYIKSWTDCIYDDIEDCFEATRKTNEDMRKEAERQIECLKDDNIDLKNEIEALERENNLC